MGMFDGFMQMLTDPKAANAAAEQAQLQKRQEALAAATAVAADANRAPAERLQAAMLIPHLQASVNSNPIQLRTTNANAATTRAQEKLNAAGFTGTPAAQNQGPVLDFGQTFAPAAAPAGTPSARTPLDLTQQLSQEFGGATVTSAYRDPRHNAEVGGVKNSFHTRGTADNPFAVDLVPPKGISTKDFAASIKASGHFDEVIDEKDHVHVAKNGGFAADPFSMQQPSVQPGDTLHAGGVASIDPNWAMSMVPNPRQVPHVSLPDAPMEVLPAAMPHMQLADKTALLKELTTAMQPKAPDTKGNAWERIQGLLQGAAQAGAQAGTQNGVGNFLLAAGGGAAAGFRGTRKEQEKELKDYEDAKRTAQTALAKMGFDIDLSNLDTQNQNAKIDWTSGENVRKTSFANQERDWGTRTKEILTNAGIDQGNIGDANAADRSRANVGISAAQQQASAANSANATQTELNIRGGTQAIDKQANTLLSGIGISDKPVKGEDPAFINARQGARYIAANNVTGVLDSLAQEMILSQVDIPNDFFDKVEQSKLNAKSTKPEEVKAIVLKALNKPGNAARAAALMAAHGKPVGTLVVKHNRAKVPA